MRYGNQSLPVIRKMTIMERKRTLKGLSFWIEKENKVEDSSGG